MAIVSSIEERRALIQVDVDGRRLCNVKKVFFKQLPLKEGDVIDEIAYLDRLASIQMNACYEDALSLLDFSARASGEMRRRLIQKGYLEQVANATVARLEENRLIDDNDYAERLVQSAERKPVGRYALQRKLRAKGVDEDAVESALESIDDDAQRKSAIQLIEKLSPKYAHLPARESRAKLSQALARRGFSWDVISSALDGSMEEDS